jgi:hypothetical protein
LDGYGLAQLDVQAAVLETGLGDPLRDSFVQLVWRTVWVEVELVIQDDQAPAFTKTRWLLVESSGGEADWKERSTADAL